MSYQQCRWYDPYPGLVFVLRLIHLMPKEQQSLIGKRFGEYLAHRYITKTVITTSSEKKGRWYDQVDPLFNSLEKLQSTPDVVKLQSTDFLMRLVQEINVSSKCA